MNIQYESSEELADKLEEEYQKNTNTLPQGYSIECDGLYFSKFESGTDISLSNSKKRLGDTLYVKAAISNKKGGEQARLIQFRERTRNIDKSLVIPLELAVSGSKEFLGLLVKEGYVPSLDKGVSTKLSEYILLSTPRDIRLSIEKTGWVENDAFVLPGKVISRKQNSELFFTGAVSSEEFSEAGSFEGWKNRVASLIKPYPALVFSVCCAFAAPLLRLLKVPSGGFHLFDPSGRGKSTALKVAASVVGSDKVMRSWRSTSNGLEAVSELHNDIILPLDEIFQVDPDQISECIYTIANEQGKQRANRQGNRRVVKSWSTLILSCGEAAISDICSNLPEGARNRLVDLEFGETVPSSICEMIIQEIREEHGTAFPIFLKMVMENSSYVKDMWKEYQREHKGDHDGVFNRIMTRISVVKYSGRLAYQRGILSFDPEPILTEYLKTAISRCREPSQSSRAIDAIKEYLLDNSSKIYSVLNPFPKEPIVGVALHSDCINRELINEPSKDNHTYVLFPKPLKKYLSRIGLNTASVLETLKERNFLCEGESGRGRQVRVSHPTLGQRVSGYPIKAEILNCYV